MLPPIHIVLSEEEFAALPESQRFLLQQIQTQHPGPTKSTPEFRPTVGRTEADEQAATDAHKNSFGGFRSSFDINRRFQ